MTYVIVLSLVVLLAVGALIFAHKMAKRSRENDRKREQLEQEIELLKLKSKK